ncbi:hypothetical protein [Terriglobus roseus]|uniref:Uncharacterized protein n=1 Tax=Terriglobus roseus TaxID=392734 RepID=A0A1G7EKI0_9BACT|nr:hypothetical protein [Terriglobus roseus]SDE63925.1 hypothetical protein SAMN05444167_0003 [Terriglobus roseus]
MYEQATIAVENQQAFDAVKSAIDNSFSSAKVSDFLKSLDRSKLRIREFEDVLRAGKLGSGSEQAYNSLNNGDQGMIREHYLSTLEKVDPAYRQKYLKVYAYY